MKSAVLAFPSINRAFVRSLPVALSIAIALVVAGIGAASAQSSAQPSSAPPSAAQRPPAAVSGWRYERGASDMHIYHCEQAACGAGSKVSYRLYAPGKAMTLAEFRDSQEKVVKALEQRTPGSKATIIGIDGDKGTTPPLMYKARRLMVAPNGSSEYVASGLMFGARASASLISSAREEKASNDNYAKFAPAVMLVLAPTTR